MALFDNFGKYSTIKGLSYTRNYDNAVNNAIRLNQVKQETKLRQEQKARYYSEKLKHGIAHDELNSKRLESYYDGLNKELGEFVMNAPENWEASILHQKEFNRISDKYLNNPILQESQRAKMELQKMYNDKNLTPEWFEQNMKRYEAYKSQEFNPENPDQDLEYQFRYEMQPTVSLDEAVSNVAKTMGLVKYNEEDGKYIWEKVEATDEQIDSAVSMLYSDPNYKYALNSSYKNYKLLVQQGKQPELYKDKLDYAEALVRNTVPIQELIKDIDPAYNFRMKQNLIRSKAEGQAGAVVPARSFTTMQALAEEGEVNVNNDFLVYTSAAEKDGIVTWGGPVEADANGNIVKKRGQVYINGIGDADKLDLINNKGLGGVNSAIVRNTHRAFIDGSGNPMVEVTIDIPLSMKRGGGEDEDDTDMVKLRDAGFKEVNPRTSDLEITIGDEFKFGDTGKVRMMRGKAYLPADLKDINAHWEYLNSWNMSTKVEEEWLKNNVLQASSQFGTAMEEIGWDLSNLEQETEEGEEVDLDTKYNEQIAGSIRAIQERMKTYNE